MSYAEEIEQIEASNARLTQFVQDALSQGDVAGAKKHMDTLVENTKKLEKLRKLAALPELYVVVTGDPNSFYEYAYIEESGHTRYWDVATEDTLLYMHDRYRKRGGTVLRRKVSTPEAVEGWWI